MVIIRRQIYKIYGDPGTATISCHHFLPGRIDIYGTDAFIKTGIFYFLDFLMFIYGYVRSCPRTMTKARRRTEVVHGAYRGREKYIKRAKKQKEAGKEYKIFVCKCQQMIRVPRGA